MHNGDKRYGKQLMRRNKKPHNFIHPQSLPHPPTTSPRDFSGYTHFCILKLDIEIKSQHTEKQTTTSLKNLSLLRPPNLSPSLTLNTK